MRARLLVQLPCLGAVLATSWVLFGRAAPVVPRAPEADETSPTRVLAIGIDDARAPADESHLEDALARVRPTDAEARLLSSADVNTWERKLKLGTVASQHSREIGDGDRLGGLYVARMKADPAAAIAAIESLLPKLSIDEFAIDRASLLDVAADLPGQQDRARALAMSQLSASCPARPSADTDTQLGTEVDLPAGDASQLPCLVAQSVLVRLASGPDEALRTTLDAISHEADPALRATFATQLLRAYPELLARLQADPRTRDLPLEIPEEES